MYREIGKAIQPKLEGRILEISGIDNFRQWIEPRGSQVLDVQYPEVDIQNLPFAQVIHSVADPRQALAEAFRVLKKGGIGIHTTRAYGSPCPHPVDYFRFTRDGLIVCCPADVEVIQAATWGNRFALGLMLLHDHFFRYLRIPDRPSIRRWLATYNEEHFPIHTWIVARKATSVGA